MVKGEKDPVLGRSITRDVGDGDKTRSSTDLAISAGMRMQCQAEYNANAYRVANLCGPVTNGAAR